MPFTAYATTQNLVDGDWLDTDELDDNYVRLLRSATFVVAEACYRNPYADTVATTDADPLRDATCAQVASWAKLNVDPASQGIPDAALVKRSTILTGTVERDTSSMFAAQQAAAKLLCPEALAILTAARLIYAPVPIGDETPYLPTWGLDSPIGIDATSGDAYRWPAIDGWPYL